MKAFVAFSGWLFLLAAAFNIDLFWWLRRLIELIEAVT